MPPSWDDFDRPAKAPPKPDEFAKQCALVFSTGAGKDLLKMFRDMTIERSLPANASESALAQLEAQRQFVRRIEAATSRGLAAVKSK